MKNRNINVHYRRNDYARTRMKVILIIACIVIAVLLLAFLIVGGVLKNKVDKDKNNKNNQTTEQTLNNSEHASIGAVKGYGISLSGLTTTQVSNKTLEISNAGGSNICFVARDSSGKEIYKSSLASSMGKQSSTATYIDVSEIESRAANRGLSSSAIVPIHCINYKDDLQRATQLFYDASVCAELNREGIDDVLIRLAGIDVSESNLVDLLKFADWAKSLDASVTLGIAITPKTLESQNVEYIVGKLWEKYDFLALDLTDSAFWSSKDSTNNEMQFYLLMYNMRVLLPNVSGGDLYTMEEYLRGMGTENWQTMVP